MDRDGTRDGFDIEMLKAVIDAVSIPVIASGGCGGKEDIVEVFEKTNCDGALAAALFHYGEATIDQVKEECAKHNIPVDVYKRQMLDLNIGKCYFAVAAYPEYKTKEFHRRKRIASKYTKVAKEYFNSKQEDVEIIKLEGSVELGPVVGLSDAIVDIVETGSTLKANGLEVIEKISDISTKMIVNKVSLKFKKDEIFEMIDRFNGEE